MKVMSSPGVCENEVSGAATPAKLFFTLFEMQRRQAKRSQMMPEQISHYRIRSTINIQLGALWSLALESSL